MATEKRLIYLEDVRNALYDADAITMKGVAIINKFPTVDAVEVVHGRWDKNWSGDNVVYCDQCYMPQDWPSPYCHFCGAKMDGDENG